MSVITQSDMVKLFNDNKHLARLYIKDTVVKARKAVYGEEIITLIDGKIETHNFAKENHIVIKGPKDEEYLILLDTFTNRYVIDKEISYDYQDFQSRGTCLAFQYIGEAFHFYAACGIKMLIENFDFIGSPESWHEIYRIEKEVFFKTYKIHETI